MSNNIIINTPISDKLYYTMKVYTDRSMSAINEKFKTHIEKKFIPRNIIKEVAKYYELVDLEKNIKNRKRELVLGRQVSMYFILKFCKMSLSATGKLFEKDHATVLHSRKTIENLLFTEPQFRSQMAELQSIITLSA